MKKVFKYTKKVIPLYGGSKKSAVHLIISDETNWKKVNPLLNKYSDELFEGYNFNEVAGYATCLEKKGWANFFIVLVYKRGTNVDTATHEMVHIKNLIFKNRGIKLDIDNDEPEAYLMGWLADFVSNEVIKINKLK